MRRLASNLAILALLLVPAWSGSAAAQEKEQPDLQAAERRAAEAEEALQQAREELRRSRGDEANRALREAIEALRLAQRELRSDEYRELFGRLRVVEPGNFSVFVSEDRPKMGVLLEDTDWRSEWDSLGAKLSAVTPGGPGDEAGLKAGDVIVSANGRALGRSDRRGDSPNQKLVEIIGELEEGDKLSVEYLRDGSRGKADVVVRKMEPAAFAYSFAGDSGAYNFRVTRPELAWTLERELPENVARVRSGVPTVLSSWMPFPWFDMELAELNPDLGAYFGTTDGLLVVQAPERDDFKLKGGDVILSIDGREPTSPAHALRIVRSYEPGETMSIEIMRDKRRQTLSVTVPERERGFLFDEYRK
jgi:C-terminal processing protease CtpA/Prc